MKRLRQPLSLDLGFLELDVLARDRVIFLEGELFRLGAGVLLRHVKEAGVGARQQLDLDRGGLGHNSSIQKARRSAGRQAQFGRHISQRKPEVKNLALWRTQPRRYASSLT